LWQQVTFNMCFDMDRLYSGLFYTVKKFLVLYILHTWSPDYITNSYHARTIHNTKKRLITLQN